MSASCASCGWRLLNAARSNSCMFVAAVVCSSYSSRSICVCSGVLTVLNRRVYSRVFWNVRVCVVDVSTPSFSSSLIFDSWMIRTSSMERHPLNLSPRSRSPNFSAVTSSSSTAFW